MSGIDKLKIGDKVAVKFGKVHFLGNIYNECKYYNMVDVITEDKQTTALCYPWEVFKITVLCA